MDFSVMNDIVTSSTTITVQTVQAWFFWLNIVWPYIVGITLGIALITGIWRFIVSRTGGGGSILGGGRRRR